MLACSTLFGFFNSLPTSRETAQPCFLCFCKVAKCCGKWPGTITPHGQFPSSSKSALPTLSRGIVFNSLRAVSVIVKFIKIISMKSVEHEIINVNNFRDLGIIIQYIRVCACACVSVCVRVCACARACVCVPEWRKVGVLSNFNR